MKLIFLMAFRVTAVIKRDGLWTSTPDFFLNEVNIKVSNGILSSPDSRTN